MAPPAPVNPPVNLFSDTQTRPTAAMRRAMAEAEVGDEQLFADPTVTALQERVAELLGHEAALFLPSGTMCNAISLRLHVRPGGDEVLLHRDSHPMRFEAGGPAAMSGAVLRQLDGDGGMFAPGALEAALRPPGDRYAPRSRVVCVEQTTNMGGGRVWPLERIAGVLEIAAEHGLRTHLDGARLLNACAASGHAAREYAARFDTAWIDFTKGLGAPVGACLAASAELIEEAWRYKQMWGGAMRQAGIVAAAGLHALEHHVERLGEDHEHARRLADGLAELPGVELDPATVETNIVVFGVPDAFTLARRLSEQGVMIGAMGPRTMRAVTHLDVDRAGIERALNALHAALQ
jgi:threonine aldolase